MMKKVVIFGATGMTGLCSLKHAISKGYDVTAFVRNENLVPEEYKGKIKIIKGNVRSYDDVLQAITGRDAAVVVLGTRNALEPTTDLSVGMQNIVKAMEEANVKLVSLCLSTFLFFENVPKVFLDIHEEHKRMLAAVESSKLNWVAVCPPRIEEYASGKYKTQPDRPATGSKISKYDLGEFLVECLKNPDNYCQKVCIFNEAE